jgi:2-methylisocitrate lyase-like PEP mutase family enzyme
MPPHETLMTSQAILATQFHALHVKGNPLILFNVWDAGSALTLARAKAGVKAIATGSWSVAAAHGHDDGEALSLDDVLANAARIVETLNTSPDTTLPVTIDFEAGYGSTADDVGVSVAKLIATGAIGANIEDRIIHRSGIRSVSEQCTRLSAARRAAEQALVPFFINARTDLFLESDANAHDEAMVSDAINRAKAYADAGASGFFIPGLRSEAHIARICEACPLPVNVMMFAAMPPLARLRALGVARVSHGPGPYRAMHAALAQAARDAMSA